MARPPRQVRLSNDTIVAAYLIDPARRRYPLDELLDEAGIEPVVEGERRDRAGRGRGARAVAPTSWRRSTGSSCARCWRRSSCRWWTSSTGWSCRE